MDELYTNSAEFLRVVMALQSKPRVPYTKVWGKRTGG